MTEYFDSHAHWDDPAFDADRDSLLPALPSLGITRVMNPGCDLASSLRALSLAKTYPFLCAAVGSHPDDAAQVDDALLAQYRSLAADPSVHAIGEIGLDYHYEDVPRARQKEAFAAQLTLARELDLPVIVHEREAHGDALALLLQYQQVRGVFHCYSGAVELAKELIRRGWYLGFTGVVTFKNARRAAEVVQWAPLDRILIETDCPYMAPEPHRGHRNDSSLVPLVAQRIASLRGLQTELVAEATARNAQTLFSFPPAEHAENGSL